MKKYKEICDSAFTLDDLIQESVDMNNFLKGKTNQPFRDENYYESLSKFFPEVSNLEILQKIFVGKKAIHQIM